MGIAFENCRTDQLPALQDFFARVYRPDYVFAVDPAFLRWQFGGGAEGASVNDRYHVKVAWLEGRIVGCLGYIPVEVSIAGLLRSGAWTANWIVEEDQRRLGLGPLLMRDLTRQFDVTLVVGVSHEARELLPRLGWTDFGELQRYVRVLDRRAAAMLTATGELDSRARPPSPVPSPDLDVEALERFHADVTGFWDERSEAERVAGTRRSAGYLNWRYADHPAGGYRLFEARRNGRVRGVAVYRVESVRDMPVRVGRLVELFSESPAEAALVDAVLHDAHTQDVAFVDFFCSYPGVSEAMSRAGFVECEDPAAVGLPSLFQPIDRRRRGIPFMAYLAKDPQAQAVRSWYVTKGDGDQDRPN